MNRRRAVSPNVIRPRHSFRLVRSLLVAGVLIGSLLPLAACDRLDLQGPEGPATPEAEGVPIVKARPTPLPSGPRLASLAVFPEVDEPLEVVTTQPPDGAEGTAVSRDEARIVVQFNHPVVPLVAIADQAQLPAPVSVAPTVEGTGEWLNTSTYLFQPSEDLLPSTTYSVRVYGGLTDILGGALGEDVTFSFMTAYPLVVSTYPEENTIYAGTTEPMTVTFNQAMDHASAEQSFRLSPQGQDVAIGGTFEWPEGRTMVFTPGTALEYDAPYEAAIAAGARAATGEAALPAEHRWGFRTTPRPAVVSTNPADGTEDSERLRHDDLTITFAGPMDPEGVQITIQPTLTYESTWLGHNDTEAHVYGSWKASESYTVTVHAGSRSRYGDVLSEDAEVRFSVAPLDPSLSFNTPGRMSQFNGYRQPVLYSRAVNLDEATIRLYELDRGRLLQLAVTDPATWDKFVPPAEALIREWTVDSTAPLNVTRYVSTTLSGAPDGQLEAGTYMVVAPGWDKHLLFVSRVNLSLKLTDRDALVWATDLQVGQPVADLPIALFDYRGTELAAGRTDADGVFRSPVEPREDVWRPLIAISEENGRVIAAVLSSWQDGIDPWAFNFPYSQYHQAYYANLYTDRPIYRPGQTVYFRGVLRRDDDVRYELPDVETVRVTARDSQGKELLEEELALSPYGTFNGQLELSPVAPLGYYNIDMNVGPKDDPEFGHGQGFRVAAYRKPEFEVEVTTDRDSYLPGETIVVDVQANYFFGGPVADAAVRWRLLTDDYFFRPETVSGWWNFIDYDLREERFYNPQSEVVREGEATLDASGRLRLELPADIEEFPLSQVFTIDVEVADINNQAVSNRASAAVHKGSFYIGLRPQRYVGEVGEPHAFDVITVDTEGITVTNQTVALSFSERTWYSVKEKREDGSFYWTSHFTDTLVSQVTVTTGDDGAAVARFTPKAGGVHRVVAEATDGTGNKVQSATYAWITTRSGAFVNWRQENNDRITLVADKKEYAPGDTAEILIPAPFAGAEALLTVERGKIRKVERITLPGNSETVLLPIESDYAPNVYVSVMLVKGVAEDSPLPQFKLGYTNLQVSTAEKLLDVSVESDRVESYRPGETVTYDIQVNDHAGKPVRAEMTLALVDKALLSLASDTAPTLEAAFYGQRMLGVGTSAALAKSADRLNQQLEAEKKGGGGGMTAPGTVRRLFRDTAYWNGALETDRGGHASVSVQLPDNLTTWNLNARAVTGADTLVGTAEHEIVSTKDVLVRPVTPRFVVVGDNVQLEAVVNNQADELIALDVSLTAEGLVLDDDPVKSLTIPAGGKDKVTWQTYVPLTGLNVPTAPEAYGAVRVRMSVEGDGYVDAVELDLPAYQMSSPEVVATAGEVDPETIEQVQLPEEVDTSQGELTVELNPSLAAASTRSLKWLASFPYDCSEQTVSKFLPNVATYRALQELGLDRPDLEPALRIQVTSALQRLYALQNTDGGWGWWRADESRAWLTAYALYGLHTAEAAGFAVDGDVMDRAAGNLVDALNRPVDVREGWDLNERAFVAYVLSQRLRLSPSRAVLLYDRRDGMALYGKAFLALALDGVEGDQTTRIQSLLADLGGAAELSATGTHWEEDEVDYWTMNTNLRTTAIVLRALAQLDPENVNVANTVRWLMVTRRDGHWETTQETVWSVLALTDVMVATEELKGRYSFSVELNDQVLEKGQVNADNVDQPITVVAPLQELQDRVGNELAMNRRGKGKLYYSAALRYYLPAAKLEPMAQGIVLGRQYFKVDPGTLQPTSEPAESAQVGDVVQVKLTLIAPTELHYVVVEDPLPAGFEAIDTSLKTASAAAQGPTFEEVPEEGEEQPWWHRNWWSYWVESQLLDNKVALFATRLDRGTYEYTYLMRASVAGDFNVIPAHAEEMYFPEVFGRSAGGVFSVTAGQ